MRLGVRGRRTKGRVGTSQSVQKDVNNPQAKTEGHEDAKLCLDKIKHSVINCCKKSLNAT